MRQFVDSELFDLLYNSRLSNVTYNISSTHQMIIYRASLDKFHLTEIIGELDTIEMSDLKTLADFRRFRAIQQAKPPLTRFEIEALMQRSILWNLFGTNIHIHTGYNPGSRNIVFDTTLSAYDYGPQVPEPPYTQIGNVKYLLETILEEIVKQGNQK